MKTLHRAAEVQAEIERLAQAYHTVSISREQHKAVALEPLGVALEWVWVVRVGDDGRDFYGATLAIAVGRASYCLLP